MTRIAFVKFVSFVAQKQMIDVAFSRELNKKQGKKAKPPPVLVCCTVP
ncbi:MAG: hypothetical protein KJ069_27245 [Anaerolineae bacterium]|nr:hypothetical protein [Anaerolineae bacterium]